MLCRLAQIAGAEALESSNRQLAAECLLTLCEAREKAPGMMRKLPQFLDSFFQCLLTFLHDIEVPILMCKEACWCHTIIADHGQSFHQILLQSKQSWHQ